MHKYSINKSQFLVNKETGFVSQYYVCKKVLQSVHFIFNKQDNISFFSSL